MICNKIKWHTIHVGIELFASPYERQYLFFCLRISSLGVCQTTTCIVDDSWSIILLLGQYRSQSNWAGIGSYLGWGILSKYPKVSTQANRSFSCSVHLQTRREFLTLSGDVKAQRPLPDRVSSGHSSLQAQENFGFLIPSEVLAPLPRP